MMMIKNLEKNIRHMLQVEKPSLFFLIIKCLGLFVCVLTNITETTNRPLKIILFISIKRMERKSVASSPRGWILCKTQEDYHLHFFMLFPNAPVLVSQISSKRLVRAAADQRILMLQFSNLLMEALTWSSWKNLVNAMLDIFICILLLLFFFFWRLWLERKLKTLKSTDSSWKSSWDNVSLKGTLSSLTNSKEMKMCITPIHEYNHVLICQFLSHFHSS